jgi:hypothetical protein
MIARASGLGMRVDRCSRRLRGVGVLEMPDAELDTTRCVQSVCVIPLGAGVLRQRVSTRVVGVIIDHRWVANRVESTC